MTAGHRPLRPDWLDRPDPSRFAPDRPDHDAAMRAHAEAVAEHQAGYIDPGSGLFVMTAAYLHDRGWCCDRGCRHCPYVDTTEHPSDGEAGNHDRRGAP